MCPVLPDVLGSGKAMEAVVVMAFPAEGGLLEKVSEPVVGGEVGRREERRNGLKPVAG
jgi:hypothetical protein